MINIICAKEDLSVENLDNLLAENLQIQLLQIFHLRKEQVSCRNPSGK